MFGSVVQFCGITLLTITLQGGLRRCESFLLLRFLLEDVRTTLKGGDLSILEDGSFESSFIFYC